MAKKKRSSKAKTRHFLSHVCHYIRVERSDINKLTTALTTLLKAHTCVKASKRAVVFPKGVLAECVKSNYAAEEQHIKNWYGDGSVNWPDLFLCLKGLKCKYCWKQFNMVIRRLFKRKSYLRDGYVSPVATRLSTTKINVYCKPLLQLRKAGKRSEFVLTIFKPPFKIDERGHCIA